MIIINCNLLIYILAFICAISNKLEMKYVKNEFLYYYTYTNNNYDNEHKIDVYFYVNNITITYIQNQKNKNYDLMLVQKNHTIIYNTVLYKGMSQDSNNKIYKEDYLDEFGLKSKIVVYSNGIIKFSNKLIKIRYYKNKKI